MTIMTVRPLALLLALLVPGAACAAPAEDAGFSVAFQPIGIRAWKSSTNGLEKARGKLWIAQSPKGASGAVARFDNSVLDRIPDRRIGRIELLWALSGGYRKGAGTIVLAPAAGGAALARLAVAGDTPRLVTFTNVLFDAATDAPEKAAALIAAFRTDVRFTMETPPGIPDMGVLLNFNERTPLPENSTRCHLRFAVRGSSGAERLMFRPAVRIDPNEFVTNDGRGDLVYCGRKLRLSGVNLSRVGRTDVAPTVRRLLRMNVNAIRLWSGQLYDASAATNAAPEFVPSVKGDGSPVDAYDALVAACAQADIFIHCTTLGSHLPPLPPDCKAVGGNGYWVFPDMIARRLDHIRRFLNHVNPYTGRRNGETSVFATYELANEDQFIPDMLKGCFRKWPAARQAYLKERFSAFLTEKYGRPTEREPGVEGGRADFLEFVMKLQIASNRAAEAAARACARPGVGIAVAPIVHGTHAIVDMNAQFVHQLGSGSSTGNYQSFVCGTKSAPFYPYSPFVTRDTSFYNLMYEATSTKFFMIYEHHPHGPYKYRCEWMPSVAMTAGGLAWDAHYLYTFAPAGPVSGDLDLVCAGNPVPEPYDRSHGGYCHYFHAAQDEILMGGLAVAGQAFLNGLKPHAGKTVVTYGKPALYDPSFAHFSKEAKGQKAPELCELSNDQLAGETKNYASVPGLYGRLQATALDRRLCVDFDENQREAIRITGDLSAARVRGAVAPRRTPNDELSYDPQAALSRLDAVHSALAAGVLPADLAFRSGVRFVQAAPLPFAFFGAATRDGKPFAESSDIIVNVSATAENTGYRLNPEKMKNDVLGLIPAIEEIGTGPVAVTHPAGRVTVPGGPFTLKRYNFAGYCYGTEFLADGAFGIAPDEPLFLARLTR